MPISEEVTGLLDAVNSIGVDLPDMPVDVARQSFAGTWTGPGPEMDEITDRSAPGPAGDVALRVYRPAADASMPVVVFFHGGGGVVGGFDSHDGDCRRIAAGARCIVVAVDYRLAPEHPFPAGVDDATAALEWVAAHAADIGGDPGRLAVAGDSNGGNLAAVVACRARDRGIGLRLQVLVYPTTDWQLGHESIERNGEKMLMTKSGLEWFRDHLFTDRAQWSDPDASPLLTGDLSGVAPALVITAEYDPLHDEGVAYALRLEEAGVDVTHSDYDGMIHGFVTLAHHVPTGETAHVEIANALRGAFGREG